MKVKDGNEKHVDQRCRTNLTIYLVFNNNSLTINQLT